MNIYGFFFFGVNGSLESDFMLGIVGATMAVEMKKVDVVNGYGEKLAGVLHDTGSEEVVVLCHGFRSSKVKLIVFALIFWL